MKMKQLTRITTLVLVLLLSMSLCLPAAAAYCDDPTEGAQDKPLEENQDTITEKADVQGQTIDYDPGMPVFSLIFEKGDDVVTTTAFYVQDTHGNGSTYLITTDVTTALVHDGYSTVLAKADYAEDATYIASKGPFAFYYAPGLEEMQPLQIADGFTSVLIAFFQNVKDDSFFLDYDVFDISGWVDYGTYYLNAGSTLSSSVYLGAPCMELNNLRIAGLITTRNDGQTAVQSLLDLQFLPETALFDADGNALYEPQEVIEGVSIVTYVIVGAVILVLIFVLTRKSSKPTGSASEPVESGSYGHTVSLDRGAGVQPISPIQPIQPIATANYQIRAIGSQMDGKVYMLSNALRFGRSSKCDVSFPQNAPGISGEHCELMVENGRVVLRDLGSSYGTYLNTNTKLEPRITYSLKLGDTFTLAEGGQTFRLESAGAAFQGTGPSVRKVDSGESYSGDMQGRLSFGRDARSQVALSDGAVSSVHCTLYREGSQLYLMDNGSTNGTFFAQDKRLKPNHPYKVKKGVSFFLVSPKNTFIITEE